MTYERRTWQDRIKDSSGKIIQEGTPFSAGQMNNIYEGLDISHLDVGLAAAMALQFSNLNTKELEKYKSQRLLQGQATISNPGTSNGYFRSSEPFVTVSISGFPQINAPNYDVLVSAQNDDGSVGELIVYDKTQNGFKVKMTGSSQSVTFLWTILNPNV
ncbi:signal transduction protein [Heyndrickxia faecalis]|uniref:signal transduction protein n=1 Tax=Heyndrickxia TaxID=2837504 RepID=UPI002E1AC896|nr:signal transduction protein [Weizmannia sp. CD-2023]